jgi:hypothetical protein
VPSVVRRSIIALISLAGLMLAFASPAYATHGGQGGRPFTISLTGEAEVTEAGVPNQGDLDGTGTATLRINPGQREVCWTIEVSMVEPIAAAHIHFAPSTTTGPVVVPLNPYTGGCTQVDMSGQRLTRDLLLAIITNPTSYYVNVHNAPFPAGALRGQLSR